MERRRIGEKTGGDYFPTLSSQLNLNFIKTGCSLLDYTLGGGWALGRVSNVIGDKAVGKTLLAIEGMANFNRQFPHGKIWYRDAEAAFDEQYAKNLGLPVGEVDYGPDGEETIWETVDDVMADLAHCIEESEKTGNPGFYIIDSLDSLSSKAELDRVAGEGTYGLEKQKMLGELFRRYVRRIERSQIHIMFISQIRDKIGVTYGRKWSRTGGKALDFYASQMLILKHIETMTKTALGQKRAIGIRVGAKCEKNKVGMPFRDCEFNILFNYGIDEISACVDWLSAVKRLGELGITSKEDATKYISASWRAEGTELGQMIEDCRRATGKVWQEIETKLEPERSKYGS